MAEIPRPDGTYATPDTAKYLAGQTPMDDEARRRSMGEWIKAVQAGLDPRAAKPEPGPTAEAPAPKRETREEQTARVLAEWEAGGN